jgi:hypothetical protein
MNNSRAEKLSKVVSAKVTLDEYNLCKEIAAQLYENGKIERNSVSELVRVLVEPLLSECRNKEENLDRNCNNNNGIQNNAENNNKMQFPMEQQPFTMSYSLISTQEYHYNQTYEQLEQQKERKKQERNQNQQLYEIMSRMPEAPTIPSNSKQTSKVRSICRENEPSISISSKTN